MALRNGSRLAAFAAILAAGLHNASASEDVAGTDVLSDMFGGADFFRGLESFFGESGAQSFPSLLEMLSPIRAGSRRFGSQILLYMPKEEQLGCQVQLELPESVKSDEVKVTVRGSDLSLKYQAQQTRERHDEKKGDSFASSSVQMSSTISLPPRCMATPPVLMSSLAGYMMGFDIGESGRQRGMVVFPSRALLEQYAGEGLLPGDIIEIVESGDQTRLRELTGEQMCLAAGFTVDQCKKLGNQKPLVASVAAAGIDGGSIPVPRYEASVEDLN